MTNPIEQYLREKEAGPMDVASKAWKTMKEPVMRTAAGVGTLAAGMAALKGLDNLHLALTKKRDFDEMLDQNPDLRQTQQEDPKRFNAQFTSLRRMNPAFSRDPVVAATYMRQMAASPATAGTTMVGAATARRSLPPSVFEAASGAMPRMTATLPPSMTPEEREMHEAKMVGMGQQADRSRREAEMHPLRMEELQRRVTGA